MHPFPFSPRGHDSGAPQIGKMARHFGLALIEDFDEITDADFAAVHQVKKSQPGTIRESGEEARKIEGLGCGRHDLNIRLDECVVSLLYSH
jgi:hypothetical protein